MNGWCSISSKFERTHFTDAKNEELLSTPGAASRTAVSWKTVVKLAIHGKLHHVEPDPSFSVRLYARLAQKYAMSRPNSRYQLENCNGDNIKPYDSCSPTARQSGELRDSDLQGAGYKGKAMRAAAAAWPTGNIFAACGGEKLKEELLFTR